MPRWRTVRSTLLPVVMLTAAGCDALGLSPGEDFRVTVLDPAPLTVVGKVKAPVHFGVSGCNGFDAAVQDDTGATQPVTFEQRGDGTFVAQVPVDAFGVQGRTCLDDAERPVDVQARLLVTCGDAGRTAAAALGVRYGTARRAYPAPQDGGSVVRAIVPTGDPLQPYEIGLSAGGGQMDFETDYQPGSTSTGILHMNGGGWLDWAAALENALVRPRAVWTEDRIVFNTLCAAWAGCPETITVAPEITAPPELVNGWSLAPPPLVAFVPAHVVDMAYAADGSLVVLSQIGPAAPQSVVGSAVTRVGPGATPDPSGLLSRWETSVIGYFPGEGIETTLSRTADGRLAFFSYAAPTDPLGGYLTTVLHTTDGSTVESTPDPIGHLNIGMLGGGLVWSGPGLQLAPDASTAIVAGRDEHGWHGVWLGAVGAPAEELPTQRGGYYAIRDGQRWGAVWMPGAVALWRGSDVYEPLRSGSGPLEQAWVEVFDAVPPHALRYAYEVPETTIYGAMAIGDVLVLTTGTGVRALGPDGAEIAGADPLPCRLQPTAAAVQTGPTTFAVGADDHMFVFDLAQAPTN